MKKYSVKQVAQLSGVSVRTLHHYDAIGLLKPSEVGDNGYRQYGREELLHLQQILFHRALGMPLSEITTLMDDPDYDQLATLSALKNDLAVKQARFGILIKTLDHTLAHLARGKTLKDSDLYACFEPEQQSTYETWLIETFGESIQTEIEHSNKAFTRMTDEEKESVMHELFELEQGLAEGLRQGEAPDSATLDLLLDRHRAWVAFMWDRPCTPEAYGGLADLYLSHPDFEKRFEQIEPGFTAYLTGAMKAYATRVAN